MVLHGLCLAQTSPASNAVMGASSGPQPIDMRVGAFKPTDAESNRAADTTRSQSLATALNREYRISPNDLLEVEVFDADNLKRTVRVNGAGSISLPLIGSVSVAGLNQQEVESRIADRYREKYLQNPQVSIFIKEFTNDRITIEGAVAKPGIFPLTGEITLLRALAMAGGFGPMAKSSEVMIFRVNEQKVRQVAVFDIEKIRSGKGDDPVIKGDDLIVVQRDSTRALFKDSIFRDIMDTVNPFSIFTR
jgi:polysaccharide biosynthesis/export protein